jgi:HAD superfamily hydrolase (TIGR01509 family)
VNTAILLDFGGTLDYPEHWLDRFLRHYKTAGLELDRATLDRAFTLATGRAYRSAERMREFRLEATIRYLVELQLAELASVQGCLAASIDTLGREHFAGAISRSFAEESRTGLAASRLVLQRLAGHYKLGVVSNFYGNLDRILEEAEMLSLFGFVGDSSRLGSFKPDPAMFHAALEVLGTEPGATLMAGDSLTKDCAPARAVGMQTAWLRHPTAFAKADQMQASDFTITALAELEHLSWKGAWMGG